MRGYFGQNFRTSCLAALAIVIAVALLGDVSLLRLAGGAGQLQPVVEPQDRAAALRCHPRNRTAIVTLAQNEAHHFPGDHWFHVAEISLPFHSKHRDRWSADETGDGETMWGAAGAGQGTARTLLLRMPSLEFYENMNPMTRLIAALGFSPPAGVEEIHFLGPPAPVKIARGSPAVGEISVAGPVFSVRVGRQGQPQEDRFRVHDRRARSALSSTTCVRDDGVYGNEWPTVQRGSWFPNADDKATFDEKVAHLCGLPMREEGSSPTTKKKLLIYQRNRDRRLANVDEVIDFVAGELGDKWDIEVLEHDPQHSPCMLAAKLQDVDVFLTPHGFQTLLLLFMRQGALVFEVYPYLYYKPAYQPLSAEVHVHHAYVMAAPFDWKRRVAGWGLTVERCMQYKICRSFARGSDVELDAAGRAQLMKSIREQNY